MPVATLVTQVIVDKGDAAFRNPTKPIGPFYSEQKALELEQKKGWKVALDSGRGWRRVVPSPVPLRIVEMPMIRSLYESGAIPIVAGGGGIPVVEKVDGSLSGVEAVIDKDLVSVVLALALGIETLLVITAVERVALDYGKPTQRWCDRLTLAEAMRHLADGQFPPGSMGPKMEAAVWFLKAGGRAVCVTSAAQIRPALQKRGGTWITA